MSEKTTTLYRPVGVKELRLIEDNGMQAFPPRLPHQPIFYPVLTEAYAISIARDWNTKDAASDYAGFVTAFDVDAAYIAQFEVKTVGNHDHRELWVPAEDLETFNEHIQPPIRVLHTFYGDQYTGDPII